MLLIIGFLFMIFFFAIIGILSGVGAVFIDLPSASLILVSLLFFFPSTKSGSIIGRYFKSSFKKDSTYTRTELTALCAAVKNTIKFILAVGGFGFAGGILGSLVNLENKNMLGPNLALSLLSFVYAITTSYFIFFPVQAWAENKINLLENDT